MLPVSPLGIGGWEGVLIGVVVSVLVVAFGTYLGVSFALQSFFDSPTWDEATGDQTADRRP